MIREHQLISFFVHYRSLNYAFKLLGLNGYRIFLPSVVSYFCEICVFTMTLSLYFSEKEYSCDLIHNTKACLVDTQQPFVSLGNSSHFNAIMPYRTEHINPLLD